MKKRLYIFILINFCCFWKLAQAQSDFPIQKYKKNGDYLHKTRSNGIMLSVGYPIISQFVNPTFVAARKNGQMTKATSNLSFYIEKSIWYPLSIQIGIYNGEFQPNNNITLNTSYKSADLKVDHLLFEAFLCSKLLPNRSRFLPYVGVGYIDGGLELTPKIDTGKEKTVLSGIKIESAAWRIGTTIDLIRESGIGDVGLMIDYMQPFKVSGLWPNTFYASNRLQAGIFLRYN